MTKRKEILKKISQYAKDTNQEITIKEGATHTRLWVGERYTTIPRHAEIANRLAEKIYNQIGMK
ncbi:toxin HicA [Corynebacterium sp. L4756]|uniref:toxin HicA n=1 Tax=unclassified Corynebacterium TaxID=2624378 RepID=UPI00374CCF49